MLFALCMWSHILQTAVWSSPSCTFTCPKRLAVMEGPLKGHVGLLSIAFAGAAFPSKANVGIFNTATGRGRTILKGQVSLADKKEILH